MWEAQLMKASASAKLLPTDRLEVCCATSDSGTHTILMQVAAETLGLRVDEELGSVRVTRVVDAAAAGKILNPQTARSQVMGGVVSGIGMALQEESMAGHGRSRFMNHNLAGYHIPVNADVPDVEVIVVDEHDEIVSPVGVKGLREIGIAGTAAAIANAIHHATGKRMRHLPITIDKVMG